MKEKADYGLHLAVLAICIHFDVLEMGWVWTILFFIVGAILSLELLSSLLGLASAACGWLIKAIEKRY